MPKRSFEEEDDYSEASSDDSDDSEEASSRKNQAVVGTSPVVRSDEALKKKKKGPPEQPAPKKTRRVRLRGARSFRARLVLSTLSRKAVRIVGVRWRSSEPGIRADEACFLRLMDKLTSGSKVEVDDTGSTLSFAPGTATGGRLEHDCSRSGRGVGWFVEGILPLAPFGRLPLELTLTGATCGGPTWRSVDALKHGPLAWLKQNFGLDVELDVVKRQAFAPPSPKKDHEGPAAANAAAERARAFAFAGKKEETGVVVLRCATRRSLPPIDLEDPGVVAQIRGVAYCTRVAPALVNRIADAARRKLDPLLADVRVTTDAASKRDSAPGPGFGLALVATTTTQRKIAVDLDSSCDHGAGGRGQGAAAKSNDDDKPGGVAPRQKNPEDLADTCAAALLHEVQRNGSVDSLSQPLLLTFMVLTEEDASVATLPAPLTPAAVDRLRLLKTFFGLEFKLTRDPKANNVRCACLGLGFRNVAKAVT